MLVLRRIACGRSDPAPGDGPDEGPVSTGLIIPKRVEAITGVVLLICRAIQNERPWEGSLTQHWVHRMILEPSGGPGKTQSCRQEKSTSSTPTTRARFKPCWARGLSWTGVRDHATGAAKRVAGTRGPGWCYLSQLCAMGTGCQRLNDRKAENFGSGSGGKV